MVESIDQKMWSRQYDGGFYSSTDGKTWKIVTKKDPDWREKWEAVSQSIYDGAQDLKCNYTEVVDGKEFSGIQYSVKTEKPYKYDYQVKQVFDPNTFVLVRNIYNMDNHELVTTYEKDETISLPSPE